MLLKSRSRLSEEHEISKIASECKIGDWFLLYQLGKNMDPIAYKDFMHELYKKIDADENGRELISPINDDDE